MPTVTCPACGREFDADKCPGCGGDLKALLAAALAELDKLPPQEVREVFRAATLRLESATGIASAGEIGITATPPAVFHASLVETLNLSVTFDAVVVRPETRAIWDLLRVAFTKENIALLTAVLVLANTCATRLKDRESEKAVNNFNIYLNQVQIVAPLPPPAPVHENAPAAAEPPPLLKRP
ncbi:MAG: hypothetical protein HZB56_07890 [Deltaproteobacteria bacterium]|nr:hypothetical protein [Deltaproteobacteria bacterium]